MNKIIQVGTTAMRNPDGSFMEAVPIYVSEEDLEKTGSAQMHKQALDRFAASLVEMRKEK